MVLNGRDGKAWDFTYLRDALFLQERETQSDADGSLLDGTPERGFLCRIVPYVHCYHLKVI